MCRTGLRLLSTCTKRNTRLNGFPAALSFSGFTPYSRLWARRTFLKKLTGLLHEAGDWHRKWFDFNGFSPINMHYRIWREGHVCHVEQGHKVLCPDQPSYLRMVDMAVLRLPSRQRDCLTVKYFFPLRPDGHPYTHRQMAHAMGLTKPAFEKNVSRGKRKLGYIMSQIRA